MPSSLTPVDPLYTSQWHLAMIGRLGTTGFTGLERIWSEYRGAGVDIGVWDDGVQSNHPDLDANYNPALHLNVVGIGLNNGQPVNPLAVSPNGHGTAVAGLIAGEANSIGGVGVAFASRVTGVTIFGGTFDINSQNANYRATLNQLRNFEITNHSYGLISTANELGAVATGRVAGFQDSILNGRSGLGTLNFASAGNSNAISGEDWKNHRSVINIAAIDSTGQIADYSSYGASVLVSAPAGSVTTDLIAGGGYATGDYTNTFGGTSAASPITAGVGALMLSANAGLGWRDVQSILSLSAIGTGSFNGGPTTNEDFVWRYNRADNWNGGGMHTSENYGFGMVNAFQAVRMAEVWSLFGAAQTSANEQSAASGTVALNAAIADLSTVTRTVNVTANRMIETVAVTITLTHTYFTDLRLEVTSPEGTTIRLTNGSAGNSATSDGNWSFTFNVTGFRGETSSGAWTVRVIDAAGGDAGTLINASITAYGEALPTNDVYHYTDEALIVLTHASQAGRLALNDTDGGIDWINAAAMHRDVNLNLGTGQNSTLAGTTFITMGAGVIENAVTGDGNDVITGNGAANQLYSMRGNDRILGLGGNDSLYGGTDNDSLYGGDNNDFMLGQSGLDYLDGQGENDALYGGDNNDTVVGNIGDDYLDGQGENDELYGNDGRDIMVGNVGNDYLDGGDGRDELYGNDNNDTLYGNLGEDYLDGQGENDVLYGGSGNDTLYGNVGNDQLWGGIGTDTLIGGTGDDQFRFALADLQAGVRDVISDFAEAGGNADLLVFFGVAAGSMTMLASGADTLVRVAVTGGNAEILVRNFSVAQLADQVFFL